MTDKFEIIGDIYYNLLGRRIDWQSFADNILKVLSTGVEEPSRDNIRALLSGKELTSYDNISWIFQETIGTFEIKRRFEPLSANDAIYCVFALLVLRDLIKIGSMQFEDVFEKMLEAFWAIKDILWDTDRYRIFYSVFCNMTQK